MADDARQVDGGLHAGIAAPDHRHPLALEEGAIAMGAVGHAPPAIFQFARDIHLPPARARGEDDGLTLEGGAAGQPHLGQAIGAGRQGLGALQVHDVHFVLADVLLQAGHQLGAIGFLDRDKVFDRQGIEHLATKAFGDDAGADALARRIDGGGGAGGAAPDDEDVEGRLGR